MTGAMRSIPPESKASSAGIRCENFATGLHKTVQWYLDHEDWIRHIEDGSYRGERLGILNET